MSSSYLDRLELYLNEDLIYNKKSTMDEYGKLSYEADVSIKGREIGKSRRSINKDGELLTTNTYVMTTENVNVGDKIDGEIVHDIKQVKDKWGNHIATECYL